MSSLSDSAYRRFKSSISERELAEVYTPTNEELIFAGSFMRNSSRTLGFIILLKSFQRLGYFVPTRSVPQTIIDISPIVWDNLLIWLFYQIMTAQGLNGITCRRYGIPSD